MKWIFYKIIFLHPVATTTLGVMLHGLRIRQINMLIKYIEYSHLYLHYSPGSKTLATGVPQCLYAFYPVIP